MAYVLRVLYAFCASFHFYLLVLRFFLIRICFSLWFIVQSFEFLVFKKIGSSLFLVISS